MHPFFARTVRGVFAHRGGSAIAPENTIAAFDAGLAAGADGLELDVRLSRDGVVVVHHDATLDRTTNLRGAVANHDCADLECADAGYRFARGSAFPFRDMGCGIPRFSDVLRRFPDVPIIVELKVNSPALAHAAVAAVLAAGAADRVCFGSFGRRVLGAVRRLAPQIATSAAREEVRLALYRSWCRFPVRHPRYNGFQVPETAGRTRVVSPRFVADAHRAGLGVQVWTVDAPDAARRLLEWGVDALITDRPDVIVRVTRGWGWGLATRVRGKR
jgi:glycerophosphoryl diester phosphodiesterase